MGPGLDCGSIRKSLRTLSGREWHRLAAWIMREARFSDVWQFFRPAEVQDQLAGIEPFLGRKREFWKYILGAWHEMGKV